MKELQDIANQAIFGYLESGKLQEKIDKSIEECFSSCIESAFRWGSLKKDIEKVIDEKLRIAVHDVDLHSYNEIMLQTLKGNICKFTNEQAVEGFAKVLSETFGEAPKEISITEIVETILNDWRTDDPCNCEEKTAKIEFKNESRSTLNTYSLSIKDGEKYSSNKFSLYFIDDRLRISHRQELNPTCMGSVEGFLFKLYAAKTKITGLDDFDPDDVDLEIGYRYND